MEELLIGYLLFKNKYSIKNNVHKMSVSKGLFQIWTEYLEDRDGLYYTSSVNLRPILNWIDPPAETACYVLLLTDEVGNYHWIVYNIPGQLRTLTGTGTEGV